MYFFNKTPNFDGFEKSYYFSPILRQMCGNLVKNVIAVGKIGLRKVVVEWMIFLPYYNMAENNDKIT